MRAYEALHPGAKLYSEGRDATGIVIKDATGRRLHEADFAFAKGVSSDAATATGQLAKRVDEMKRAASPPPPPPAAAAAYSAGDDGSPAADDGGGDPYPTDEGAGDPYGQTDGSGGTSPPDDASDDPTVVLPDGYLAPGDDGGGQSPDMAGIDYNAAFAGMGGLGDWTTDLENFGKQAAVNIGKQALTTIGSKLTKAPPAPPPARSAGLPIVPIAIGAVVLGGLYMFMSHRGAPAPSYSAPAV
jgi:hypothetical protein